ncbi:MAG: Ig-like domain repeat protein, partial [Acidobacteriaceae bacterium]
NQFRSMFGLPANPPQVIIDGNDPGIDGNNNPDGPVSGSSLESYLDVEWADAVAPKANIDLIVAADTELEYGGFLAAERAVDSDIAPVISSSIDIGGCEQTTGSYNPFIDSLWQQAAAEGITVVVAAGDSGSAGCDSDAQEYAVDGLGVDNWASTPWDIAVGGTDFYYTDYATAGSNIKSSTVANYWNLTLSQNPAVSLQKYVPEQPWNDSQFGLDIVNYYTATQGSTTIAAGSGGASSSAICSSTYSASTGACLGTLSGYPKPAWQTGVTGIPNDNVRDIPDVSLFAADGLNASYYPICASDGDCQTPSGSNLWQITGVGGTSGAAPAFAGIMALVNEKYGAQGQAAAVLYPLKTKDPAAFHDITSGTNAVPCATGSPNCVSVTSPITIAGSSGTIVEGETGSSAAADYKAAAGYNLATGLGSVDAANLIANWSSAGLGGSGVTLTSPIANSTFAHGAAVTFTGTATGSTTPTGSVAIMTSSPETSNQGITTLALNSSGGFSGAVTYLPGGTYTVWASYGGDAKNGPSTSLPISITVSQESSTVTLAAQNLGTIVPYTTGVSVPYGTQLLFDAQVFGASCPSPCNAGETSATGSMVFADGANQVGTVVLSSEGSAEWNAPLTVGSHSIIARYPG